jgi:NADH-quinone oxidoreductase subunit G
MVRQGGCIDGGGQPIGSTLKAKERRIEQIYKTNKYKSVGKSYGNPAIIGNI